MSHYYRLYGTEVHSAITLYPSSGEPPGQPGCTLKLRSPRPLPELTPAPNSFPLYSSHGRELFLHSDGELATPVPGQAWQFEVRGVLRFGWRSGTDTIDCALEDIAAERLLAFWFIHLFLPLYLTLEREQDFMHAAGCELDGQALLFVAPSTGGKSTLADYFLRKGHPLLSDDKVATFPGEGGYRVAPSHPHHRPYREHEVLGRPVANFATGSLPLKAFYALEKAAPESSVQIEEVGGFRKFERLEPNYLFGFDFLKARRLRWLGALAGQVPLYRVSRPWDLARQDEVYDALLAHASGPPGG